MVEKAVAPKEIFIPKAMAFHLLQHMANKSEAIDDEHLESDRYVPKGIALEQTIGTPKQECTYITTYTVGS